MTLKLKTAEERAAEIRAESQAIEAAAAEKKAAETSAKTSAKASAKASAKDESPEPNYAELARAEEAKAAALKAQVDEMQMEIDPSLRVRKPSETVPHVVLSELLNKHDSAQDTLDALHDAIRKMREQPGLNEKKDVEWPADLSHLTDSQRTRTMAEMEAGKKRSEAAAAQQERTNEIRRTQAAKTEADKVQLAALQEQLAAANATIAVLRHNPSTKEVFPAIAASKVVSNGAPKT